MPRPPRAPAAGLADQEARVLEEFAQHFGVRFHDPGLLKLALTHRSYLHVTGRGPRESNERLEFLGDSVLGLVTSEHLYRKHPTEHEGQLTKTKSLLVSKAILSRRALAMGLGRFVFMSHSEVESGGRQRLSILADAFESVVGAIYLDQGFEAARQWLDRWLLRDARIITADKRHTNYKSHLQEYVQSAFRTHPVYRIRSAMGPDHSKMFMVEVMVGRRVLGEGRGKNKKEAEQAAARDALERAGSPVTREEEETRSPRVTRRESRAVTRLLPEPETGATRREGALEEVEPRRRRGGRGRGRGGETGGPPVREAEAGAEPRSAPRAPLPARRPARVRIDEDWEEVGRPEGFAHEPGDLPPLAPWPAPEATAFDVPVREPEPEDASRPMRTPGRAGARRPRRGVESRARGDHDREEARTTVEPPRTTEPAAPPGHDAPAAPETPRSEPSTGSRAPETGAFGRRMRRGR